MIEKIIIENFRSIKSQEIKLGPINAFVGPNNAGKSNIMKALNLVLGDTYPSVRSFDEKDFYNYDKSNHIKIEVRFDSPLTCNSNVYGFRLTFDGANCEYLAVDSNGNALTYSSRREVRVSNEMKEEVALMFLGLERQASHQIRATQWTLYGKVLRHIEKQIDDLKKQNFKSSIENSYNSAIHPYLQQMEDILKTHVKNQTGLNLHLRLSVIDPIETIKNLRPYLQEDPSSKEFDAEDMGYGTQSALAIAIARAYAEIIRQPLVMAIEEPELYLHPHGCRHFYKLLKELSQNGVQILYTTHERSFVDISNFQSIHLVRKELGETKVYSGIAKTVSSDDAIKMASKFDERINEIFFANHVILVGEGIPDKIACQLALEKLGLEIDKEGISIIECGGNQNIKPICEVLKHFKIPVYVLADEDPGNPSTQRIISELRAFLGNDYVFLQTPNFEGMFGLKNKPSKIDALKFFPNYFNKNPVPNVYEELVNKIR
jgi:predicted ATP-dependent endonuclease of OLD family